MIERLGAVIWKPRFALAIAGDRRNAGQSGSDLIKLLVLVVIATQLRGLTAAVWSGIVTDIGIMMRLVVGVLTRTLTVDLGFLLVAAIILWITAGKRRELGRAFDLACVVAMPLVLVQLAGTVVVRALDLVSDDLEIPRLVPPALAIASYAWAGIVLAYAIVTRPTTKPVPPLPAELAGPARRLGWGVIALAAIGIATQTAWIVQHPDLVRPMQQDDPAPAFTLPEVTTTGALGPRVALPHDQIVVIDFWATWCKPCLASMPELDKLTRKHPNVRVLAVNVDDAGKARDLFDAQHYAMTLLFDDNETAMRYGVQSYPHTVLIGSDGRVRVVSRGGTDAIAKAVDQLDH